MGVGVPELVILQAGEPHVALRGALSLAIADVVLLEGLDELRQLALTPRDAGAVATDAAARRVAQRDAFRRARPGRRPIRYEADRSSAAHHVQPFVELQAWAPPSGSAAAAAKAAVREDRAGREAAATAAAQVGYLHESVATADVFSPDGEHAERPSRQAPMSADGPAAKRVVRRLLVRYVKLMPSCNSSRHSPATRLFGTRAFYAWLAQHDGGGGGDDVHRYHQLISNDLKTSRVLSVACVGDDASLLCGVSSSGCRMSSVWRPSSSHRLLSS